MSLAIAVLGSGKMARNIGLWFARAGHRVTLFPSTMQRCDECGIYVQKRFRRMNDLFGGTLPQPRVCLLESGTSTECDIVVEATAESLEVKQRRFSAIGPLITPHTLLCSATSSILPSRICPDCVGMHFFYPLEMTAFVELILETTVPKEKMDRLESFAVSCSLAYVLENETSAFCANRLLMPLQAEALRMVAQGFSAREVDDCTVSDLISRGQIGMMDAVGLDTVYAGVCNYTAMMSSQEQENFAPLADALGSALDQGKLGRKNMNGLVPEDPPSRQKPSLDTAARLFHAKTFLCLFVNTCCSFMERGIIDAVSLDAIVSKAFQASRTLAETIGRVGGGAISDHCGSMFSKTGISYFKPSRLLSR
jgi:3-hydroxybutyryl-CoA dehydrogenase